MKTLARMMLILVAGRIAQGADKVDNKLPVVFASVRFNIGEPPAPTISCAEGLASQIFAKAGVRVIWYLGLPAAISKGQPILIDISPNASETFHSGALAYAQAFDGVHITIFWNRLRIANDPRKTTVVLAHVLVHEMTHILQGTSHHSAGGIMKAHWTNGDIYDMVWKPLSFDPEDVALIQSGLAGRGSRSEGDLKKIQGFQQISETGTNDE